MDKPVGRPAFRSASDNPFNRFRTPVGTYVREDGSAVVQQLFKQHCDAVERIIFCRQHQRFLLPIPVERGVGDRFGKVAVGHVVGPHALTLEAARNRVAADRFLMPADGVQLVVAQHDVADDHCHLGDKLPLFFLILGTVRLGVLIEAFRTVGLNPGVSPFVFFMIVNFQIDAADDFRHIHPFRADA